MAKNPAFPFYASDWLGSTKRAMMSLAEQGAYINLLCHQWNDPTCSLPDDDEALAALSGLREGWFNGGCRLVRLCFPKHPVLDGRIANPRLLELRAERDEWRRKSSEGGKKSAKVRRAKRVAVTRSGKGKGGSTTVPTKGATKRQPNGNSPSPSPSIDSSCASAQEQGSHTFDPLKVTLPLALDTPEFHAAWSDWCQHRREIRKKLTKLAVTKQLKALEAMGGKRAIAAIEHSIAKGWTGIFEPEKPVGQEEPAAFDVRKLKFGDDR